MTMLSGPMALSQQTLLDLSRWQFALTAGFHITFPEVTVGTSVFLVFCYAAYLRTGKDVYLELFRFWRQIFAIGFGLGVVAGIVLTFEFGLNWGGYARAVGPILGVIIGMEVVTAFFLEAGFLGLLIYGDGRVSKRVMMFSTCMVSLGTLLSVTWILAANSWMQTPQGFREIGGQFQPASWTEIIFNPAFVLRFPHMLVAVLISACWFVAGISAWYLVKGRHLEMARRGLSVGLGVVALLVPIQMYLGDHLAAFMAEHQPAKVEAFEGNWDSGNTGYNLLVVPDQAGARNRLQISVPCLGSIVAKDLGCHSATPGLKMTPPDQRPNMTVGFYGFRAMYFGALTMFAVAMTGVVLRLRGRLFVAARFHRVTAVMAPIGVVAIVGGWVTSESGRQPWVVYGRLLTRDAVSPLAPGVVLASFVGFVVTYAMLLGIYVWSVARVVRRGPGPTLDGAPGPAHAPRRGDAVEPGMAT